VTGFAEVSRSGEDALEGFYAALLDDNAEELYERAPCGYLSTTPDGTIIKVNRTFLTWTGYAREDLVGRRSFADLLTAGGRMYHETHFAPMLQMHGSAREIAFEMVTADRQRLPVLVNSVLERDADGVPIVVRTAIFDATERREYERELIRAKQRAEESEHRAKQLVHTLQQTLIPPAPPEIAGLDVAAVYRPAHGGEEVGGDFYDVFEIGPDDWIVTVGDVTGKGINAAIVTTLVRHTIRAAGIRHRQPSQILESLNEVLLRDETARLCTVTVVRLRLLAGAWNATVCNGGHPLPLLTRVGADPTAMGRPGSLLGMFDTPVFSDSEIRLRSGEAVVLYTDGVTEGRSGHDFFGEHRLQSAISAHEGSAKRMTEGILHDVLQFQLGQPRDDIVVLVARVP
jgi:sigma-B regulation protein RsbU (phosphoserine phosphatase)